MKSNDRRKWDNSAFVPCGLTAWHPTKVNKKILASYSSCEILGTAVQKYKIE